MKKKLNIALLVLGILSTIYLLIQVLPGTQSIFTFRDRLVYSTLFIEIILIFAVAITSFFPKIRIITLTLATIILVISGIEWEWFDHPISIYYAAYALLFIGFNLYYKS